MLAIPLFVVLSQAIFGEAALFDELLGLNVTCNATNLPCLDTEAWWGPTDQKATQNTSIIPFTIEWNDTMIADLRSRLNNHLTFTPPLEGINFTYGFNTNLMENLTKFWAETYPFAERVAYLNKYPMYKTNIQGIDMFFVRVTPEVPTGKTLVPILLLHGYPGSFREFYESIPLLTANDTSRDFVLELIIPSLPGFGYSGTAVRPGLGAPQSAVILRNLMHRLNHTTFYVQGGDFGGITAGYMATMFPEEVLGFHTNWPFILHPTARMMHVLSSFYPSLIEEPGVAIRNYPFNNFFFNIITETGYLHMQSTRPDSIGVAISDSPAGLMAYQLITWNSAIGQRMNNGLQIFDLNSIFDHLMIYWAPNSITTAFRYYAETFNRANFKLGLDLIPCQTKVWSIQPRYESTYSSPAMIKIKYPYLVNTTVLDKGGHFLSFETPEIYSNDVLLAITKFREMESNGTVLTKSLFNEYYWTIDPTALSTAIKNMRSNIDIQWFLDIVNFIFQAFLTILRHALGVEDIAIELLGDHVKAVTEETLTAATTASTASTTTTTTT